LRVSIAIFVRTHTDAELEEGEKRAKEVGVRLGGRGADDVADAHVACCAVERRAAIVTSDRADIEALIEPGERVGLIAV
jgi:hypothetical protein